MSKRGRPSAIESQKIVDAILEKSKEVIISKKGNIAEKKNIIWEIIAANLNNLITPFSLYAYVTGDRFQVKSKLFEREGIYVDQSLNSTNDTTAEESANMTNTSDFSPHANIKRSYSIYFTKEEFSAIIITKTRRCKSGKNRNKIVKYKALNPGIWEDEINDRLIDSTNITCGLSFKNHYIASDESSGKFNGYCDCGSIVDGIIKNDGSNEKCVEFICTITKGSGECGKRWLKGKRREDIVKDMGTKTVYAYRAEKAAEKMEHGDREPPNLPSSPVLRNAKYQYRKKKLLHADPIRSLQILKHTDGAFIIKNIGLDPFYIHFWSRHQLNIFRDYAAKEPSCLSIDATGSIIKKIIKHDNIKSKTIYFYHGVIRLNEGQLPVMQMISESQDANAIHYWLMEWVRSGVSFPKEVVIDGGRGILTAAVRAFTGFKTIHDYADGCYGSTMPTCYIRMDNAHFMNTYVKLLKGTHPRVATFYKAVIGQLIICRTQEKAKKIIRAFLLVSQIDTDGNLPNGNETEVEKTKNYLTGLIIDKDVKMPTLRDDFNSENKNLGSNTTEDSNSDSDTNTDRNKPEKKKFKASNQWSEWGRIINKEIELLKKTQIGDRVNAHYLPNFALKLLKDLPDLPLWSCIVRDEFGFGRVPASSASVESEFNKLKNSFLKDEDLPMRVDEFVSKYINYLNGRLKIIQAKISESTKDGENQLKDERTVNNCNKEIVNLNSSTEDINVSCGNLPNINESDLCSVCLKNDKPTGGHKCFICFTPIHNLEPCSSSLNLTDEFGQERVCVQCQKAGNIDVIIASREKENWRGQANKIEKPPRQKKSKNESKKPKYIAKYYGEKSNLIEEELQMPGKIKKLQILKNGSFHELRAVTINKTRVNAILTCPFDSVYQIVAAAICDWPEFRATVEKKKLSNPMYKFALDIYAKGINSSSYVERAKFHYNFGEHEVQPDQSILLRCETSVAQIVLRAFMETPSCKIMMKCDKCAEQKITDIIAPVIYMTDIQNGEVDISKLQGLSMNTLCTIKGCGGRKQTTISELGKMIIFEIFNADRDQNIKLESLPKYFSSPLNDEERYKLVGAVNYEPSPMASRRSSSEINIGHFVAFCLRGNHWVEYDDRRENEKYKKSNSIIDVQILVYVKMS